MHEPWPDWCDPAATLSPVELIIQIPALNEEAVLPGTLGDLPREVPGFDRVEWLVIDYSSSDRKVAVAREQEGSGHAESASIERIAA